jgi:hypothetical protein
MDPNADPELARTLLGIQHAAYAVESDLIDDARIPALHEDVEDLGQPRLLWLAATIDNQLVGAVASSEADDLLYVDRLIVAPGMRRRGDRPLPEKYCTVPETGASERRPAATTPRPRECMSRSASCAWTTTTSPPDCG